jgi:hypothetical protein
LRLAEGSRLVVPYDSYRVLVQFLLSLYHSHHTTPHHTSTRTHAHAGAHTHQPILTHEHKLTCTCAYTFTSTHLHARAHTGSSDHKKADNLRRFIIHHESHSHSRILNSLVLTPCHSFDASTSIPFAWIDWNDMQVVTRLEQVNGEHDSK